MSLYFMRLPYESPKILLWKSREEKSKFGFGELVYIVYLNWNAFKNHNFFLD